MARILIFYKKRNINENSGGPSGYLSLIYNNLNLVQRHSISFLDDLESETINKNNIFDVKDTKFKIKKHINEILYYKYEISRLLTDEIIVDKKIINSFDAIYFHDTISMYSFRSALLSYKGKVFLQSHSPKPTFLELLVDCYSLKRKIVRFFYKNKLEKIDKYCFLRADTVVFPCKEAEEPYFKKWRFYRKIRKKMNVAYLLTVASAPKLKSSNYNLYDKFNITKETLIFLFIGRHNKVKGYDLLIKIIKKYKNNKRVLFLVCGGKLEQKTKYTNWIELGYTKDVYQLITGSNYVFSLNRDTYFDLSVLESLSLGKTMVISENGGNRKIKELFGNNLFFYKTKKELFKIVELIVSNNIKQDNSDAIKCLYNMYFRVDSYINDLSKLFDCLNIDN